MYRVCCPCIYKKQKSKDEEEEKRGHSDEDEGEEKGGEGEGEPDEKPKKKRPPKKVRDDDADINPFQKYQTIGQLTNATVVTRPPPMFARYMLRKSVDRLNTEVRSISLSIIDFFCSSHFSFELLMNFDHDWKK